MRNICAYHVHHPRVIHFPRIATFLGEKFPCNPLNLKDTHSLLVQLMLANGYNTNPDIPGTEKIVVSSLRPEICLAPRFRFQCTDLDQNYGALLPVHGCFLVKGWSRTLAAYTILLAGFHNQEFWKAGET